MDNVNFDEKTMGNIKNMVEGGNISEAISQISPEMIQSFSKMLANQNQANNTKIEKDGSYGNNSKHSNNQNIDRQQKVSHNENITSKSMRK